MPSCGIRLQKTRPSQDGCHAHLINFKKFIVNTITRGCPPARFAFQHPPPPIYVTITVAVAKNIVLKRRQKFKMVTMINKLSWL